MYGLDNFSLHIFVCLDFEKTKNVKSSQFNKLKEFILMEEQKCIDFFPFNQLYNINPKADSTLGSLHTLETKYKIKFVSQIKGFIILFFSD